MIDLMNIDLAGIDLKGIDLASVSVPYLDPVAAYFTYRQTAGGASVGAGKAKITAIYGNSLVWNQLVSNGDFSDGTTGWSIVTASGQTSISASNNEITCSNISSTTNLGIKQSNVNVPAGHKIYVSFCIFAENATDTQFGMKSATSLTDVAKFVIIANSWTRCAAIVEAGTSGMGNYNIYGDTKVSTSGNTYIKVKEAICIDLTLMFGEGNEPTTVAEFEALYPLNYYGYNAGQIINNKATAIETRDANNALLDTLNLNLTTLTGKLNGQGNSVVIAPDGLKSAGTVYDEAVVEGGYITRIIKRIGAVDLGDRNWSLSANSSNFYTSGIISDAATTSSFVVCADYAYSSVALLYLPDKSTRMAAGRIYLKDTSYNGDTDAFKTAMNGVEAYYVLTTPLEYVLDTPIKVEYREDPLGTERRLPTDTADIVNAPFKGMVAYPEA